MTNLIKVTPPFQVTLPANSLTYQKVCFLNYARSLVQTADRVVCLGDLHHDLKIAMTVLTHERVSEAAKDYMASGVTISVAAGTMTVVANVPQGTQGIQGDTVFRRVDLLNVLTDASDNQEALTTMIENIVTVLCAAPNHVTKKLCLDLAYVVDSPNLADHKEQYVQEMYNASSLGIEIRDVVCALRVLATLSTGAQHRTLQSLLVTGRIPNSMFIMESPFEYPIAITQATSFFQV